MSLTFYTGATGFLGRNLLGALMRETGDEYLVLIRFEKSKQIIERHVPAVCLDRITYVTGGLRRPGFGLAPRDADLLKKCETFWHLAASTSFNDRDRDMLVDIKVGGTQKILETARKARKLDRVFYMGPGVRRRPGRIQFRPFAPRKGVQQAVAN